ncbi:MAG: hypothetical protein AAF228_07365 [Pseudomonadota bacterium]
MARIIRSGFLDTASRKELIALVRNSKAESRVTRWAIELYAKVGVGVI